MNLYDASLMSEEEVVERYYNRKIVDIPVACYNMQQRLAERVKSDVERRALNHKFNIRRTTTSIMARLGIRR